MLASRHDAPARRAPFLVNHVAPAAGLEIDGVTLFTTAEPVPAKIVTQVTCQAEIDPESARLAAGAERPASIALRALGPLAPEPSMPPVEPYDPINVLKRAAADVWIVDGPILQAPPFGLLPVPIRMTVVRLPDGSLWLHSPVPLDANVSEALQALGPIRHLVVPSLSHNSFATAWQHAFPAATVHAVAGVAERLAKQGKPLRVDRTLGAAPDPDWGGAFAALLIRSSVMDEAVFFHRASRTLILTDLVQQFERSKLHSRIARVVTGLAGTLGPPGSTPRYLRVAFLGQRRADLRRAVRTMIDWAPERVIFAHGAWFESDGAARLQRAFDWLQP